MAKKAPMRVKSEVIRRDNPAYQRLLREIRGLDGAAYTKAGYLGLDDETTEDGITMPQLAAVHEYGNPPHIPARPHMGPAFDANRQKYERLLVTLLGVWMDGRMQLKQVLGIIGLEMVADVRRLVTEGPGVMPVNAPRTLERKLAKTRMSTDRKLAMATAGPGAAGAPRTLVDTGRMIGSLSHIILTGLSNRPKADG